MKDNIHVIKSAISTFNNTMSKVNENVNLIEKVFEQLSNSNDKLEIKTQIISLLSSIESIVISLSFDIDDINNAILFS